ncbi:hypothetical protein HMPREF0204_11896 [Chryseobacterium gleum ATCC 35910]|jgi:hypothetical protein|uniref:Uncharacterized protein n=1 Tax=Chryseobacterium gleum ATCC 35910 TaxID=525257 RepID=A0ABP2IXZ4_CHRGE|nr:hypothetical protein HMPREF0204_11896 [Chryseobacterium gleum ATCC 35910]
MFFFFCNVNLLFFFKFSLIYFEASKSISNKKQSKYSKKYQ